MFKITRLRVGVLVGFALLIAFPLASSFASPTGYDIDPEFIDYYEQSGGLPVFGYAVSESGEEDGRLVQYFERQRFELHPEHAGTPYNVLLGHLGRQDAERRGLMDHDAFQPRSSESASFDSDFFPQTGHSLSGLFREYWHSQGLNFGDPGVSFRESLALFGYPISEEFVDPETGLVSQYFERARFEHHPEHAGTEFEVLLGHLGHSEVDFLKANGRGPASDSPPGQSRGNNGSGNQGDNSPEPTVTPQPDPEPAPSQNGGTPKTTIQQLVDQAPSGSAVTVPAGIYREMVTINKPITLRAEPGAEIRGSDVWNNWSQSGGRWVSYNTLPRFDTGNLPCIDGTQRCKWPEQVFIDGNPLRQVASSPGSGQFSVNQQRQIVLGSDPSGRTIEVSTRQSWIQAESGGVSIEGFTMTQAATSAQAGALNNGGHDNWTIRNNNLSHAHGAPVSLWGATGLHLIDNEISYGGSLGVHGWGSSDVTVQGNKIHNNNTEDFARHWEAGALKFSEMRNVTIVGNEVYDNNGQGIWIDIDGRDITIRNNRLWNNYSVDIHYEISSGGQIYDNVIHSSREIGIQVANSHDTVVRNNVVAWTESAIKIVAWDRTHGNWGHVGPTRGQFRNIHVHSNDIIVGQVSEWVTALTWEQHSGMGLDNSNANNRGENNRYYFHNPNGNQHPFAWIDRWIGWYDLDRFNETPGESEAIYLTNSQKDEILRNAGVPGTP